MDGLNRLPHALSRRGFVQAAFAAVATTTLSSTAHALPTLIRPSRSRDLFLDGAVDAAQWIRTGEMITPQGKYWLAEPTHPSRVLSPADSRNIRRGSAGILLFFLEMYAATGDRVYLEDAVSGAQWLAATWQDVMQAPETAPGSRTSLYDGLAGIGFALAETWRFSGEPRLKQAADAITSYLSESAIRDSDGVSWSETAGIAGDSSVILYLVYAANVLEDTGYRDVAAQGANRLLSAETESSGNAKLLSELPTRMAQATDTSYFPNFEHGKAGIAYTLARVYEVTEQADYLDAARDGARHIEQIACRQKQGILIPYCLPENASNFQIGFGDGAAGTARLFYQLHKVTSDNEFFQVSQKLAEGVLGALQRPISFIPQGENALCQRSGKAGVTEFLLGMEEVTRDAHYTQAVDRIARETLDLMDFHGQRNRWFENYSRVPAPRYVWETGYSLGVAGIGSALLHTAVAGRASRRMIQWPDNPFPNGATLE